MGRFDRATATSGFSMPAPGWRPSAEELEALLQLARSDAPRERQLATKNLCTCHMQADDERVGDAQQRLLEDPDPCVRRDALLALTDSTPRDRVSTAVAALERRWNDPDPWLRRRIRKTLTHHRRSGTLSDAPGAPSRRGARRR